MVDLLVENPHMIPQWLLGFFLSVCVFLGIWWFVRKFRNKGMIAVFVGITIVAILVLIVRTISVHVDYEECDIQTDEPCEHSNLQLESSGPLMVWALLRIFSPDTLDSYVDEATREKSYSYEVLAGLDESVQRQIFEKIMGCRTTAIDAVPSSPRLWDPDMYLQCRDEVAADYGLTRDDLTLIEDGAYRRDFSSVPSSVPNSADSASLEDAD